MNQVNNMFGLGEIGIEKVLNFLPYPFLVSEWRNQTQHNLFVNKKFIEEIGYTCQDIPTIKEWFERAYPDVKYRTDIIARWMEQLNLVQQAGGDVVILKAKVNTALHGQQWYEVKTSVSGPLHLVAFVNINNEIIKEEELEQLNENKNRILSILSHDLRTPLTNLHSILQLSVEGSITVEEYASSIKKLRSTTANLIEFLNTTLYWTRANFDKVNPGHERVNVVKLISEIIILFENSYKTKGIDLQLKLDHKSILFSDPEILSIVFRNILSNAIKFTADGTIIISSCIRDNYYVLSVNDSGTGMTQERIASVLSGHYQSKEGTNQEKGLGIGLKLCNDLLAKIEGHLEIKSIEGKGTTVSITIKV